MARENQLDRQVSSPGPCVPSSLGTSSTVCVMCPQVKEQLIRETIELVDPVPFDREALLEVLRRRLGCKEAAGKEHAQLTT
jgi:hypothetical protein